MVLDTQTVHASINAPAATTGLDPGKKSRGRKRGIASDVLGLVIAVVVAVVVAAAGTHDNQIGITLLDKVAAAAPSVRRARTDAGFKNAVIDHGATAGIQVQVVAREPGARGFAPLPKRWKAEQVFGTLMLHRRLVRDDEALPAGSASMVYWSMIDTMTRRLTGASTPTWRAPAAAATAPA